MKRDELKWNWVYYPYLDAPNKQEESALKAGYIKVVSKDEADAVIKELKAQKAQAEDDCAYWKTMAQKNAVDNVVMAEQRAEAFERERHHKYKRCLAVARRCHNESLWWYSKGYGFEKYDKFWEKWENRWLQLAEKFKEVK